VDGVEDDINMDSGTGQHTHQSVDAEKIDSPPNEVADPWLCHPEKLGGFQLSEAAILDEFAHNDHERRTDSQVFRLSLVEAQIPEYISA
jgi:hypothetical protein